MKMSVLLPTRVQPSGIVDAQHGANCVYVVFACGRKRLNEKSAKQFPDSLLQDYEIGIGLASSKESRRADLSLSNPSRQKRPDKR